MENTNTITVISELNDKIVKDQTRIKEVEAVLKTPVDLDKKMSCMNELTWLKERIKIYKRIISYCLEQPLQGPTSILKKLSDFKATTKESLQATIEQIENFEVTFGVTSDSDEDTEIPQMTDLQAKVVESFMIKRTQYEATLNALTNSTPLFGHFAIR